MKSSPNTEDHPDGTRGPSPNLFAHHTKLADIPCERQDGRPCLIDLLGRAGLPVPDGVILGR